MHPLFCACLSFVCNGTLFDSNTKSNNMSIIYCILDFRFIGAPYLEALFAGF